MYVKISIISLFALLLIGGATTPSIVFGDPAFNVPDKYSPESTSCSLPDETVTFSVDKNSYKFGDEIKVSGQVIPKLSTNYSDQSKNYVYITIPKAKSTFITPADDGTQNTNTTSTYDGENASRMVVNSNLSTLDTKVQIDECVNFNATIKVIPIVLKNGVYVLNVKYVKTEVQEDIVILDEEFQRGCFAHSYITGVMAESGRCGDFKGDDSDLEIIALPMPEIILTTDKDEYIPGEKVKISGQIKNANFYDDVNLVLESSNTSDETTEPLTRSFALSGLEPKFSLIYTTPSGVNGIGSYSISVTSHLGLTTHIFTVDDESIVTDFAAEKTMSAPSIALKKIIDKHNRITVSEIQISLGEKTSEDKILLPRVLQGSLFTAARGDESSVNLQVLTSSGQCVIGQDSICAVTESTRKSGSIYELVQIDGKNYNVRYSGSDVRLEKFTIIPETSNTEITAKNWHVTILKDSQPTKFYYKTSYVLLE